MPPLSTTTNDARVFVTVGGTDMTKGVHYNISSPYTSIVFTAGNIPDIGDDIEIKFNIIESDDFVEIYLWKDSGSEDLIMNGTVSEVAVTTQPSGSILKVRGKSQIETLFETMVSVDGYGYKTPEIVGGSNVDSTKSGIIDQQHLYNSDRKIYYHPDNPGAGVCDNQDYTTQTSCQDNGGVWTTTGASIATYNKHSFIEFNQPAIDLLDKVSAADMSGNQHIFYVKVGNSSDNANEVTGRLYLVWIPKDFNPSTTITIPTTICNTFSLNRPADDVINVIIYRAGKDCYERNISYLVYDNDSLSSLGAKWKFVTYDITGDILTNEFQQNSSQWATEDGNPSSKLPSSYPYTFQFDDRDANGAVLSGTAVTVNSDGEFNTALRKEAKYVGKNKARAELDILNKALYRSTLVMPRVISGTYVRGALTTIVADNYNVNKILRLETLKNTFWKTTLSYKQDPENAIVKPEEVDAP